MQLGRFRRDCLRLRSDLRGDRIDLGFEIVLAPFEIIALLGADRPCRLPRLGSCICLLSLRASLVLHSLLPCMLSGLEPCHDSGP